MDFKTSCDGCIFATRDNNGMQLGCQLGRIEKFKNVVNENGSLVITDSICTTKRTEDWGEPDINRVLKEVEPSYTVVLYLDDNNHDGVAKFITMVSESKFKLKLHIVINTSKVSLSSLKRYLCDFSRPYQITRVIDPTDIHTALYKCLCKTNTQYIVVCTPDVLNIDECITKYNHAIIHDLKKIIYVRHSVGGQPLFCVHTAAYLSFSTVQLYNDKDEPINLNALDKIAYMDTFEEYQTAWEYEQLC